MFDVSRQARKPIRFHEHNETDLGFYIDAVGRLTALHHTTKINLLTKLSYNPRQRVQLRKAKNKILKLYAELSCRHHTEEMEQCENQSLTFWRKMSREEHDRHTSRNTSNAVK